MDRYYRLWADINVDAVRENIINLKQNLKPGTMACGVIKADGYGHGAVQLTKYIDDLMDFYAAATIDEAVELRKKATSKPVIVLGYVHPSMTKTAIENGIRLTVYSLDMAEKISAEAVKTGKKAKIHIKVDTGMGRIGFNPDDESIEIVKKIYNLPGIETEGLFTHFANSDDKTAELALKQLNLFNSFAEKLEKAGVKIPVKHCANSAAATYLREADMDMVRLGISMYGLYPSEYITQIKLVPAMSLKSHVIMVKTVPAGTSVGYGSTWTADKESMIATIPIGYADGYLRSLSNKGYVLINGAKYPVVGRVCMDQMMVDITGSENISEGDEAVIIGRSGDLEITTDEIALLAGSFNYEFVCGINKRVPRKYYVNGQLSAIKDEFEEYYH